MLQKLLGWSGNLGWSSQLLCFFSRVAAPLAPPATQSVIVFWGNWTNCKYKTMNNYFFPDDLSLSELIFPQIFSEPSFVQFIHRKLAYVIFIYVLIMSFFVFYNKEKYMYNSTYFLLIIIFVQVLLGILTLLSGAYIWIASLHQISTIFLLISSIYFYYKSIKT